MQEDCDVDRDWLLLRQSPRRGTDIRPQGKDIARGTPVLAAGARLDPRHPGLLA